MPVENPGIKAVAERRCSGRILRILKRAVIYPKDAKEPQGILLRHRKVINQHPLIHVNLEHLVQLPRPTYLQPKFYLDLKENFSPC